MSETTIEWTDKTWNPVRGCNRVSPGCDNCYAMRVAHRFSGEGKASLFVGDDAKMPGPYHGLTTIRKGKVDWAGVARFVPEQLGAPLHWKKPRRIFVNSMSDLFHHSVTNEQIAAVFGVMAACPQHTFQVLTKRPERMAEWVAWAMTSARDCNLGIVEFLMTHSDRVGSVSTIDVRVDFRFVRFPLPNVWLGVSAENQDTANERIPLLLKVPSAVRFVSAEPLLGPIDFSVEYFTAKLGKYPFPNLEGKHRTKLIDLVDWVIVGGESGPGARPCDVEWIRSIVRQCAAAATACFVKQLGATFYVPDGEPLGDINSGWSAYACSGLYNDRLTRLEDRKGGDVSEWAHDLRVRQMPAVAHV